MKKIDLEIKRMLSLLETKMGNVKPLLSEQLEDSDSSDKVNDATNPEGILTRMKETGCLTNKGATKITDIGRWQSKYVGLVNKNGNTQIAAGEPYLKFDMKDKNGDLGRFFVFGKRGRGPQGTFYLLKQTNNKVFQPGVEGYEKPHFIEDALRCPEFEQSKSEISQDVKLTADQIARRDDILRSGAIEANRSFTTERPTAGTGKRYVAVDLNTGFGTDGKQYIKKTAVDSLVNVFPTPGRFFIWVDLGQEERGIDIPAEVEKLLATMGYTRQKPLPGTPEASKPTTVKEMCKNSGNCDDTLQEYADTVEGDRKIWPMTAKQKEDAEKKFNIKVSDYKSFVATSAGGREARKAVSKVQSQYADKDSCRAAITVLHACMKTNDDGQCADTINTTYAQNYQGTEKQYFDTLLTLKELVNKCDTQDVKLTGLFGVGGKSYESMKDELKKSTSKFSPYGSAERRDISLEESLTRNIRSTIREHARKNMTSRRRL
jgi:hypothetical protein